MDQVVTDNPNVDDVVSSAFDQILNGESATPEITETKEAESEEVQPEKGEPVKADAQQEESFSTVDPETLPEELKGVYKSLLGDYTRKRQAESKQVKDLKAELDALKAQLDQSSKPEVEGEELSPMEQMERIAEQKFQAKQEELFRTQAKSDYQTLDERVNDTSPDSVRDEYLDTWLQESLDRRLSDWVEEGNPMTSFDYKTVGKELIKQWDEYQSSLFKRFLDRQKSIAKEKSETLVKRSPEVSPAKGQKVAGEKVSIDEALDMAFTE